MTPWQEKVNYSSGLGPVLEFVYFGVMVLNKCEIENVINEPSLASQVFNMVILCGLLSITFECNGYPFASFFHVQRPQKICGQQKK